MPSVVHRVDFRAHIIRCVGGADGGVKSYCACTYIVGSQARPSYIRMIGAGVRDYAHCTSATSWDGIVVVLLHDALLTAATCKALVAANREFNAKVSVAMHLLVLQL